MFSPQTMFSPHTMFWPSMVLVSSTPWVSHQPPVGAVGLSTPASCTAPSGVDRARSLREGSYWAPASSVIRNAECCSMPLMAFGVCLAPNACFERSSISATVPLATPAAMLVPLSFIDTRWPNWGPRSCG